MQSIKWIRANHWRFSPSNLYEKYAVASFDRRHGVDTMLDVQLSDLRFDSPNKVFGRRYHATPPVSFKRVLARLNVDLSAYTFIDLGSGKGRTLLIAGDYPFKQTIGVEFGEELHLQAQRNIASYKATHQSRSHSLHMDATQFVFPEGPLIIYLFNPFGGTVLRQVLANIQQAASASKRKIFVIYLYLEDAAILAEFECLNLLFQWRRFDVFECIAPALPNTKPIHPTAD